MYEGDDTICDPCLRKLAAPLIYPRFFHRCPIFAFSSPRVPLVCIILWGSSQLFDLVDEVAVQHRRRIKTSVLNEVLSGV